MKTLGWILAVMAIAGFSTYSSVWDQGQSKVQVEQLEIKSAYADVYVRQGKIDLKNLDYLASAQRVSLRSYEANEVCLGEHEPYQ